MVDTHGTHGPQWSDTMVRPHGPTSRSDITVRHIPLKTRQRRGILTNGEARIPLGAISTLSSRDCVLLSIRKRKASASGPSARLAGEHVQCVLWFYREPL